MYYITPFTYWIGGVLTSVLRGMPVTCDESELAFFRSPPNQTCEDYAGPWLESKGVGYLSNPDSYGLCGYCEYSYGDDVSAPELRTWILLTLLVSDWAGTRLIQDLAVFRHLRGVCHFELSDGLPACLPAICHEAVLAEGIKILALADMSHDLVNILINILHLE